MRFIIGICFILIGTLGCLPKPQSTSIQIDKCSTEFKYLQTIKTPIKYPHNLTVKVQVDNYVEGELRLVDESGLSRSISIDSSESISMSWDWYDSTCSISYKTDHTVRQGTKR